MDFTTDLSGIRHLASKTQVVEKQANKKPTFSWNNVDDAPKKSRDNRFGHYVEPSPAQWTKYKPYQQDQKVGKVLRFDMEGLLSYASFGIISIAEVDVNFLNSNQILKKRQYLRCPKIDL